MSTMGKTILGIMTKSSSIAVASLFASLPCYGADNSEVRRECSEGDELGRSAVAAIYYDAQGNKVQTEDLWGVRYRCLRELKAFVQSPCSPGYCEVTIGGVKYCRKCP